MKYIIANRLAGRKTPATRRESGHLFDEGLARIQDPASGMSLLGEFRSTTGDRRTAVIEAEPARIDRIKADLPTGVLVEEAIEHHKAPGEPFDLLRTVPLDLASLMRQEVLDGVAAGEGQNLRFQVTGRRGRANVPVPFAEIHVYLSSPYGFRERLVVRTDKDGKAQVSYARFFEILAVLVLPYTEFWPLLVRGGSASRVMRLNCDAITTTAGAGPGAWWHEVMNIRPDRTGNGTMGSSGQPVRIGVIDSGCGPSPALAHVINEGSFIEGTYDPDGGDDSGAHGTHVVGIIGARPGQTGVPFQGLAPAAAIHSARVFPAEGGANQGDIADAIDHLVGRGVHLINMSLGAGTPSEILHDAIVAAYERGVLCVCAAGNEAGTVSYPARFPEALAVSALGLLGAVPPSSLQALPVDDSRYGRDQLYLADFSNWGAEIDLAAPGVGIVSTVPQRFGLDAPYAAMNGTSMASPAACGAAAIVLGSDRRYPELDDDQSRSRYARNLIAASCRRIFEERNYEGSGLPTVT